MSKILLLWYSNKMDKIKRKNIKRNMLMVLMSLIPPLVVGVYVFGYRVVVVALVAILSCVSFERLFNVITKKVETIDDYSAVVTGVILACLLPANIPFWMIIIGAFVSIVIGKKLFGGLGSNFVNPAALGIVFLSVSYPMAMTTFAPTTIGTSMSGDEVLTPLQMWITGNQENLPSYIEIALGFESGAIGGISIVALTVSGVFLMWKRIICPVNAPIYLITIGLILWIMGENPIFHIITGDAFFVSIFLLNDRETTPKNLVGKVIFSMGAGILTVLFRVSGVYLDGAVLSVLIMNLWVPLIKKIEFKEVALHVG